MRDRDAGGHVEHEREKVTGPGAFASAWKDLGFETLPEIWAEAEEQGQRHAVEQALEEAIAAAGYRGGAAPPPLRHRILDLAARKLLTNPATLRSALLLTQAAGKGIADRPSLANIRLVALQRMGSRNQFVHEANRLLTVFDGDAGVERMIAEIAAKSGWKHLVYLPPTWHDTAWGTLHADLALKFAELHEIVPSPNLPDAVIEHLRAARREKAISVSEFRSRLIFGVNLNRYLKFVRARAEMAQRRGTRGESLPEPDRVILALWQKIVRDLDVSQVVEMLSQRDPDRSILILSAHTGVVTLLERALEEVDLPKTTIGNRPGPDRDGRFNVATIAPDAAMKFAKLVKMAKKSPRAIHLFPDGGMGEQVPVTILGSSVPIGVGAGTLAHFGRADSYFVQSHCTGEGLQLRLRKGPVATQYHSPEALKAAVNDFYAGCLSDIAAGPPEDIGNLASAIHQGRPQPGKWPFRKR